MNPKISIIIPVFNSEKFLVDCINSVLNQTFKDFELILVNDGSIDHSGIICDEYAKRDHRVKVIHKENAGLSSARNAGLDVAKGDFLGFIDSDDYIDNDMYELLYSLAKDYNADLTECNLNIVEDEKVVSKDSSGKIEWGNNLFALKSLLEYPIRNVACTKLFKREIFNNLRFPDKLYEDGFLAYKVYFKCDKYVYIGKRKYHYVQRKGSIMDQQITYSLRNLDGVESQEERFYFLKNTIKDDSILRMAEHRYFKDIFNNYRSLQQNSSLDKEMKYRENLRKQIIKNYLGFISNPSLREFKPYIKIAKYKISIFDSFYKVIYFYFNTIFYYKRLVGQVKYSLNKKNERET